MTDWHLTDWHFGKNHIAFCGADEPNQGTTCNLDRVTCKRCRNSIPGCLRKREFSWRGYTGEYWRYTENLWCAEITVGGVPFCCVDKKKSRAISRVRRALHHMRCAMRKTL